MAEWLREIMARWYAKWHFRENEYIRELEVDLAREREARRIVVGALVDVRRERNGEREARERVAHSRARFKAAMDTAVEQRNTALARAEKAEAERDEWIGHCAEACNNKDEIAADLADARAEVERERERVVALGHSYQLRAADLADAVEVAKETLRRRDASDYEEAGRDWIFEALEAFLEGK